MADISACSSIKEGEKCKLRYECKRYSIHLAALSKRQSYIKAAFNGQSCEFFKEI